MDQTATKHILEAALLAANASISFDKLADLFSSRGVEVDRSALKGALAELADDYSERQIELKETASGFRIQVKSTSRDWLQPLFEERAPRYTRALLETLALIAYRQPITRAEIEEVRGVAVSSNIVRTLMERGWIRVVGHRDVPGHPSMLGTTREFLDYFGLKRLDDLPPLAELREIGPNSAAQADFIDELAAVVAGETEAESDTEASAEVETAAETEGSPEVEASVDAETEASAAPAVLASEEAPHTDPPTTEDPDDAESLANVVPIQQSEA